MWLLIENLFLMENILDEISKLSLMKKKSKPSLMSFKTLLSADFQKLILNALLKKILLMLFGYFENFLEHRIKK